MIKVALVALAIPVNQLYSYKVNSDDDLIGYRVLVQFGSRIMTGVVVDYDDNIEARELKEIIEILDESPFYNNNMLKFTKFISDYYMASWGETLKLASPPGINVESNTFISINEEYTPEQLKDLRKRAPKSYELFIALLNYKASRININSIKKNFKQYAIYSLLENLERRDFIKVEDNVITNGKYKKVKTIQIDPFLFNKNDYLNEILQKLELKSPGQARLLSYIHIHQQNNENVFQDIALNETKCDRKDIQSLKNKKIIITKYIEDLIGTEDKNITLSNINELELPLSEEQNSALEQIKQDIKENNQASFLLRGVTGSGKTLIYMHLFKELINEGKSVLMLVPEISLTPQLADRFKMSFGNDVALIHSRMNDKERIMIWKQISLGKKKIVIGARSAIFAPIDNLGLIIVDEEHDLSYKQESPSPRYNARDIALTRAKIENCPIILGTATPSLESYYNAIQGKFKLIEINNRADNTDLPKIVTVDMGEARRHNAIIGSMSQYLLNLIEDRIDKKEGIILYQNRRGFSPVLRCVDCSHIYECPHCSIKLTHHKSRNLLKCHFCGYTEHYPVNCKVCNGQEFESVGYGTQRIEDEINDYFKDKGIKINIDRLDQDSVTKKDAQRKILEKFHNGKTDILVGTQMVTKGLNFDRVTLVGVINADLQLYMPDFRANEKSYQTLTQVAGRAGRKSGMESIVVIQTFSPNNYSIKSVQDYAFIEFYKRELDIRNNTHYPPFSRVIILEFYGEEEEKTHYYASNFRSLLPENSDDTLEIFGPFVPTTFKQAGNYRRIIMIKSNKAIDKSGAKIRSIIKKALTSFSLNISPTTVMLKIDIDSYSQM